MTSKPAPVAAFTVDRKAFADAVGKVARFIPERAPVPVLRGILIIVGELGVELTATDYEDTARLTVSAIITRPGRFLLDGALLACIVRNLAGDTVRVAVDGAVAVIGSGTATFRLLTMPTEDYPDMSEVTSADLDRVKPLGADAVERGMSAHPKPGTAPKMWRSPGRSRTLYAPTGLQPGAWITWTRHHRVNDTVTEPETIRGQVWSAAPSPRSVWAIAEGELRPVRVSENTYGRGSWSDGTYEKYKALDEFPEREVAARAA